MLQEHFLSMIQRFRQSTRVQINCGAAAFRGSMNPTTPSTAGRQLAPISEFVNRCFLASHHLLHQLEFYWHTICCQVEGLGYRWINAGPVRADTCLLLLRWRGRKMAQD